MAKMSRAQYVLIALGLHRTYMDHKRAANPLGRNAGSEAVLQATESVADVLGEDNPRFDRSYFLAVVKGERDINSHPPRLKTEKRN